jgi:hypothetical protein
VRNELLAVDPTGARRAGVPIHVDLIRRMWSWSAQANGDWGVHFDSHPVDTRLGGCDVVSTAAPVSCEVTVPEAGYFLLRATAKDPRGNPVAVSEGFYAMGNGEGGRRATAMASSSSLTRSRTTPATSRPCW